MSKGLSKYKTVKNPCKICFETVKRKNGLQCMGACEAWVHYQCLNYTPGQIYDIKKGLVEVTCPCPNCNDGKPNEYRTDALYRPEENIVYANQNYQNTNARNIRPIPSVASSDSISIRPLPSVPSSDSIKECIDYENEFMPVPQQVHNQAPVLHTNQWLPAMQPKTEGIPICSSSKYPVNVDPNSGNLMEQMIGTIGELSQWLQALMIHIQRNSGFEKSYIPPPIASPHVQPSHSQKRNPAVLEWSCNESNRNDLRNLSLMYSIPDKNLVMPKERSAVVNQFGICDQQSTQPTNAFVIHKKCCYYPKDRRLYRY